MIQRLNYTNVIDMIEFLQRIPDNTDDFYVTINKERIYLKNNWNLITKILKQQEVYALYDNGIKAVMLIYREKTFRPYIKLLSEHNKYYKDLLKFLHWNFSNVEIYCKIKKYNRLNEILQKNGLIFLGNRGQEILLVKKAFKVLHKLVPKDLREKD